METDFRSILKSIDIGKVRVPNRIVLLPVNTSFGDRLGNVTDRLLRFHQTISRGQVGLSIVGSTAVSPEGKVNYFGLALDSDRRISGFERLFHAIHEGGSIPAVQLMHAGRQTFPDVTGGTIVAPSSLTSPYFRTVPRALGIDEIHTLIGKFAKAALRAKRAGAKIVELHGAHGYLIGQFLSPLSNKRNDEYGGSLTNRTRFFCEIIKETKRQLGSDFPIICRISIDECLQGGIKPKDSLEIAEVLTQAGADCINITMGIYGQKGKIYPTNIQDQKIRFQTASKIRKMLKIPIICGGRIANLFEAERMLEAGKADLIGMARALIADPHLVIKSIKHSINSIVACKWCNQCTYDSRKFQRLNCAVNPFL